MNDNGKLAIFWDMIVSQTSGVAVDTNIDGLLLDLGTDFVYAKMDDFASSVNDSGVSAIPISVTDVSGDITADISRSARNPQVALDSEGRGVVAYEAYVDADNVDEDDTLSYGILYSTFVVTEATTTDDSTDDNSTTTVVTTNVFTPLMTGEANTVLDYELPDDETGELSDASKAALAFVGDQVNPSVAMDANGGFAITWNGPGAQPDPLDETNPDLLANVDEDGVWIRWFDSAGNAITTQQRVNVTEAGTQQFGSIRDEP